MFSTTQYSIQDQDAAVSKRLQIVTEMIENISQNDVIKNFSIEWVELNGVVVPNISVELIEHSESFNEQV